MTPKEKAFYKLLADNGFVKVREANHNVWQNPDGLQVVTSKSPSDQYWAAMALRDLRRKLAGHTVRHKIGGKS